MSPKMYIPMMVTFTESEYLIVQNLMNDLCVDDKQFSATVRLIVREWKNLKEAHTGLIPKKDPDDPTEADDLPSEHPSR